MKKMLLLLVSGLLIASLVGPALADPCNIAVNPGNPISIIPDGSSKTSVPVFITDITSRIPSPHTRLISVHTDDANLHVRIFGNGVDITTSTATVSGTYTYNGIPPTFTMELWGNKAGGVTVTDWATVDPTGAPAEFDVGTSSRDVNVPEFPTVALPVAGVLGLLFVFGRKKEGL